MRTKLLLLLFVKTCIVLMVSIIGIDNAVKAYLLGDINEVFSWSIIVSICIILLSYLGFLAYRIDNDPVE